MLRTLLASFLLAFGAGSAVAQEIGDPLSFAFSGGYGQVEVGGRFVGAEFHESRPLPSRISFYYPVANSIDLSTDYWKRGDSRPMAIGIRVDGGSRRWIGREAWSYQLSPHTVEFHRDDDGIAYTIRYEFGFREPVMVCRFTVRSLSEKPRRVEAYVHLKTVLRSCQTYARFDSASVVYDSVSMASLARFQEPQTGSASVVVQNVGVPPAGWVFDAELLSASDSGTSKWVDPTTQLGRGLENGSTRRRVLSAFTYERELRGEDSLAIVLLVSSCRGEESHDFVSRMRSAWEEDVRAYDSFVRENAIRRAVFRTGDSWIDRSAIWAKALLSTNAHYLDGVIVPMPCPAEYNFFFTHDALKTDLAAVNFDLPRVEKDLRYIASHAKDSVIPHAYYWRDDGFKTEICAPDNWNHLWFILLSARYLRHSMDVSLGNALLPLATQSVTEVLKQVKGDTLMWANSPDWWDIGKAEGPRAYSTALVIRALREYVSMSTLLGKHSGERLSHYELLADAMQRSLERRLWDNDAAYLLNFNGELKDRHYYMGSLIAPVFGVLSAEKSAQLVATASRELADPRIGVRTVFPVDFNTDSLRSFFQFVGNEAGDPYVYANGGVWPQDNAWYVLALLSVRRGDDAFQFFRRTMTIDGIAASPMGQPAMYEYRFSDPTSAEFGKIDKPSFLWAGGFYLYTLYNILGVEENQWNISLAPPYTPGRDSVTYSLAFGTPKRVVVHNGGDYLARFVADGIDVPSRVLPVDLASTEQWQVEFGKIRTPYLDRLNGNLRSAIYTSQTRMLTLEVLSFDGGQVTAEIRSASAPRRVLVDGKTSRRTHIDPQADGTMKVSVRLTGSSTYQKLQLEF